jgi:hypothetical protein
VLVKAIHEEFKINPPMPEGVAQQSTAQAQFENKSERYSGETVPL